MKRLRRVPSWQVRPQAMVASMFLLVTASCSVPANPAPSSPVVYTPSSPSVARDAAVVADAALAVSTEAGVDEVIAAPPDAAVPPKRLAGAFDWQAIRDKYAPLFATPVGTLPCDYRDSTSSGRPDPNRTGDCVYRELPKRLAAVTLVVGSSRLPNCEIVFDLGGDALVRPNWFAALLDDDDVPITKWTHPEIIDWGRGVFDVPCDVPKARAHTHVALVRELRWR